MTNENVPDRPGTATDMRWTLGHLSYFPPTSPFFICVCSVLICWDNATASVLWSLNSSL